MDQASDEGEMSAAVTAVGDLLADSGVVPRVRALIEAPQPEPSRLGYLEAFLRRRERDAIRKRRPRRSPSWRF